MYTTFEESAKMFGMSVDDVIVANGSRPADVNVPVVVEFVRDDAHGIVDVVGETFNGESLYYFSVFLGDESNGY